MKFSKYFMLAGAAALFAACSSEEPLNGPSENNTDDRPIVGYTKLYIGDEATRSNTDAAGTTEENEIESVQFFFYNSDGELLQDEIITADKFLTDERHTTKKCVVVALKDTKIMQVAALVNTSIANPVDNSLLTTTDQYRKTVTTQVEGSDETQSKTYFYMSSNTVYDGADNAVSYKVPVGVRYDTEAKAIASESTDAARINVERMVAKVNVTKVNNLPINITPVTEGTEDDELTVAFEPQFVGVTARNPQSYWRKELPAYSTLDQFLKTAACPAVEEGEVERSYWTQGVTAADEALIYLDWPTTLPTADNVWGITQYARDHVGTATNNRTSVVVAGKYTIKKGNTVLNTGDGDFYLVPDKGKFSFFTDKTEAIKAMGGNGDETLTYDPKTGWWSISNSIIKCLYYNGGRGYYSRNIWTLKNGTTYYYGIVRNHVYNVEITGITGMGIGIKDDDEPIVPITPKDPNNTTVYLHMNVNVVPWKVVNQSVAW